MGQPFPAACTRLPSKPETGLAITSDMLPLGHQNAAEQVETEKTPTGTELVEAKVGDLMMSDDVGRHDN
jgi:hypothetical protein